MITNFEQFQEQQIFPVKSQCEFLNYNVSIFKYLTLLCPHQAFTYSGGPAKEELLIEIGT